MSNIELLTPDGFPLASDNLLADAHQSLSQYFGKHTEPIYTSNHATWELDARQIIPAEREAQLRLMLASIERLMWLTEQAGQDEESHSAWIMGRLRNFPPMLRVIMVALGEEPLLLSASEAEMLAQKVAVLFAGDMSETRKNLAGHQMQTYQFPVETVVRQWERFYKCQSPSSVAVSALAYISRALKSHTLDRKNRSKFAVRIDRLLGDDRLPDVGDETWANDAVAELNAMPPEGREAWSAILAHAGTANGAKPSAKWLTEVQKTCRVVGQAEFASTLSRWLIEATPPSRFTEIAPRMPQTDNPTRDFYRSAEYQEYQRLNGLYYLRLREYLGRISEKNITILKGLAWYCASSSDRTLAQALGHLAIEAFGNVVSRGAWAKTTGNATIWALGQMPDGVGVGPLARLRTKLRDRGALKLIAAGIESAAAKAGMTVDELEDLAVPTGGLDADGKRQETFGEIGSATLRLDPATGQTTMEWFGADGKPRKAVPAAVKAEFGAEVKALKAAEEEIKQALGAQSARLDRAFLDERSWTGAEWRERYWGHPVLGNLARRLIWTFDGQAGLPTGEGIIGADGQALSTPGDGAIVRLWHPIGREPKDVLRWRDRLEARGIVQPFKQAYREVYLLTDAERNTRTYSNRFAAHILKQHQFNSLAVLRGWKNSLRLMVDDSYPPATKLLPQHGLRAEFWVEGIGDDYSTDTNETGTYLRVATDQVRFYALDAATNYAHAGGGGYAPFRADGAADPVPLDQIPPLALSETMRDVDLFVGVASLGNDPNWADGGPQGRFRNYWQEYSFGDLTETAKTRADVLGRLLPRLKIGDRCRLEGRFLVVRGDLRTYKIHLGSGNILMEPNDQYLCIVPKSGADDGGGGLMLPFEGDRMLSVIVSKAFLLAADTRITDPTITRQIGVH